ncbi:transposase, partial [Streptomyces cinereoruber]|uniref:transposase n=1 Tax=Streptomyces cinereoruber TaxID=67260 RepID=UPI003636DF98
MDDDLWALVEPLLPPWPEKAPGPRPVPDRQCLQGILYVLHNDIACQLLPLELGFGQGRRAGGALSGGRRPESSATADEVYGQEWKFRRLLEELGVGYVVAVPKSQQVKSLAGFWRIDELIAQAPDDAWQRRSCGDGAKGPRLYDWASVKLPSIGFFDGDTPTHHRWVLARRSLTRPD